MNYQQLAKLLFPVLEYDRAYFEAKYPPRDLANGAEVTRLAPSPTGELHAGALYVALINNRIAHQSGGKMVLRIEDTDSAREVAGARGRMVEHLANFGINFDEGLNAEGEQYGEYGPYIQSERVAIYRAFLADFVAKGFAYPCFMTSDELEKMREEQTIAKVRPGVYGKYAKSQNLSLEEIESKIKAGEKYVIRLRSSGNFDKKIKFTDEIMGGLELSENDEHFVIAKSDGIPTYHFAHLIDDYLMRVTFVVRANEWVASITKHLELWDKLGVTPIKYGHLMPINKKEGNTIRKLSKRKDSEASVSYYVEAGYPKESIVAYLLRLANPNFDEWWLAGNRNTDEYILNLDELKRNSRGPLLDFVKLDAISSDYIASLSAGEVTQRILNWAIVYDADLYALLVKHINYLEEMVGIERGGENARKDIKKWSEVRSEVSYFFDELFPTLDALMPSERFNEIRSGLATDLDDEKYYDGSLDLDTWIGEFKTLSQKYGYPKFGEFMMDLRLALTGKKTTPNMYYLFKVMGKERVERRIRGK